MITTTHNEGNVNGIANEIQVCDITNTHGVLLFSCGQALSLTILSVGTNPKTFVHIIDITLYLPSTEAATVTA